MMRRVSRAPVTSVAAFSATALSTARRTATTRVVVDQRVSDLPKLEEVDYDTPVHHPSSHQNHNQPAGLGDSGFVYGAKICDPRDHAFVACEYADTASAAQMEGGKKASCGRTLRRLPADKWKQLYGKQAFVRNGEEFYRDGSTVIPSQATLNEITASTIGRTYIRTPTRWWVQRHSDGGDGFATRQTKTESTWSEFAYSVGLPPIIVASVLWLYTHDFFALYSDWSSAEGEINPELFRRRAILEAGYQEQIAKNHEELRLKRAGVPKAQAGLRTTEDGKGFYTPLWDDVDPNWARQGFRIPNGVTGFRNSGIVSLLLAPGRWARDTIFGNRAAQAQIAASKKAAAGKPKEEAPMSFEQEADMLRD